MTTISFEIDITRPAYGGDGEITVHMECDVHTYCGSVEATLDNATYWCEYLGKEEEVILTDKEEDRATQKALDIYWDLPKGER